MMATNVPPAPVDPNSHPPVSGGSRAETTLLAELPTRCSSRGPYEEKDSG